MPHRILKALSLSGLLLAGTASADITVETRSLTLAFSDQGDLLEVNACFPECTAKNVKRAKLSAPVGMFVFEKTEVRPLDVERERLNSKTILTFRDVAGSEIHRWEIPDQGWVISVASNSGARVKLQGGEAFTPPDTSGFGYFLEQMRYLLFNNSDIETIGKDSTEQTQFNSSGWFGFRSRFWAALILSERSVPLKFDTGVSVVGAGLSVIPDSENRQMMKLYLGPVEPKALNKAAAELDGLM